MFEQPQDKPKYYCHSCGTGLSIPGKPGRRDECPKCTAELHVCLNCELYDSRLARGCREPQADEIRDVARANFCGWFTFRPGAPDSGRKAEEDKARSAFEGLFKKG